MRASSSPSPSRRERGAAMVMFALLAPVILAAASLALDVGWAAYVKKRAQSAADAAALAAITAARQQVGVAGSTACGALTCQPPAVCPAPGALEAACKYASANAYSGGASANRTITVAAGANSAPPGAAGTTVNYWVEVSVEHDMNSWFSGMASAAGLHPKATAVAALTAAASNASIYLLNRKTDCFVSALNIGLVCGEDFLSLGFNDVKADMGIYMASSNPSGIGLPNIAAGTAVGTLDVQAPFTRLMGQGGIKSLLGLASVRWSAPPQNGFPDGDMFTDPMAGRGQPPAPTGLTNRPIALGAIVGSLNPNNPTLLPPGNYYASLPLLGTATGLPITIAGNVRFGDGQNPPCGGFCEYVFHGGLVTAALSQVTFSPGRYVFAGAQAVAGAPGVGLSVGANAVIKDLTPVVNGRIAQNADAGEIFIFTDSDYAGLQLPAGLGTLHLPAARAGVMAGVNPTIVLHGLNGSHPAVPAALKKFAPVLIWQDQANTTLRYTPSGRLDMTCGGICSNLLSVPGSQEMIIQASGGLGGVGTQFFGTIYGPRGSWLTVAGLLPGDHIRGPYQIITGALQLAVNANLGIDALPSAPMRLESHLIR